MKYAAGIGAMGLDYLTYTQTEVYSLKSDVFDVDNIPLDYIPEDDPYHVVKILKGARLNINVEQW